MSVRKKISKFILPLTYKRVYTAAWSKFEELQRTQWNSKKEIHEDQIAKIKNLLNHAYHHVTFYKKHLDKSGVHPNDINSFEDFAKLPVISKKNFLEYDRKTCTADNIPSSRVMYQSTSGSTGTPFEYAADKAELGIRHLVSYRSFNWAGWNVGDKYVYFDGMIGGDGFHPLIYKLYLAYTNFTTRRMHIFSPYISSETGMRKYLKKVYKYNPIMIRTTVSQIRLIMNFVKKYHAPFPKCSIITVGETLTSDDRMDIREILGCEIFESYGAGEFCGAYECDAHEGLHVAEENVYLEVLNEEGKSVKPGELGRIVITNLNNYAWPFIRYDMGDLGILSDKECSCGRKSSLLIEVAGRVSEFVVTADNKLMGLHDFTQIIGHNTDYIREWQVQQEEVGKINLLIVPTEKLDAKAQSSIIEDVRKSSHKQLDTELIVVDEIPTGRRGKRHLIKSLLNKNTNIDV